jgi:hypothetical protein
MQLVERLKPNLMVRLVWAHYAAGNRIVQTRDRGFYTLDEAATSPTQLPAQSARPRRLERRSSPSTPPEAPQ